MLASVYRVDVANSLATLTYWNGSAWVTENKPLTVYPELLAILTANSQLDPVLSKGSLSLAGTGRPYYPTPGDNTTYNPPTLAYRVELPTRRNPIPDFTKRKRAGEILVSDYAIGYVDVVSKPCRYETATTDYVDYGNFVCVASKAGSSTNPLSLTGLGKINGKNSSISYFLRYRRYTYDTRSYLSVPAPKAEDITWDLFPCAPDAGVVTSAAAQAVQGAWDALTELAEAPETISLIGRHTHRVGQTVKEYVQGAMRLAQAKAAPRVIADHWLQFRYAVMPIFYSLADIRAVIHDMLRVYAEFRSSSDFDAPYPFQLDPDCEVNTPQYKGRCMVKNAYTPDSMLNSLAGLIGFNPVQTAWELRPLSFVADWFVNISDWIIANTSLHMEDYARSTYSVKYDHEWTVTKVVGQNKASLTVNPNVYQRIVINPSDHIGLKFGLEATWKRSLDSVALSLQPLNRLIRRYR